MELPCRTSQVLQEQQAMQGGLIEPHGGTLSDLMVDATAAKKLIAECEGRVIQCSDRNACDVELLCVGGFSPLQGFMNEARHHPFSVPC